MRSAPPLSFLIALMVLTLSGPTRATDPRIEFEATSAREVLLRPEGILEDPDRFWETDPAYRLAAMWHTSSRVPIPREAWERDLRQRAGVPPAERGGAPGSLLLDELMRAVDRFNREAAPHICSFLPREGLDLHTTIHFTAGLHPYAFQIHRHIVLDVTHAHFKMDADRIMNCLVHEVFHIGYGNHQRLRRELDLDNAAINTTLNSLQNEGMATYVAYRAQAIFPASKDPDYRKLERKREVKLARHALNDLFRRMKSENPDDLWSQAWRVGVDRRGYYTFGAYMAQIIDERLGREALVETVDQGPRAFMRTYNTVADEGMEILEFEEPTELTRQQRIRKAAREKDAATVRALLKEYTDRSVEPESALEHTLISAALQLQHCGEIALAIDVLETNASIHPESSAAHQFLADAWARTGLATKAIAGYRKSIELDPEGICAFNSEEALAKLDRGR